jgi:hypothetical protein
VITRTGEEHLGVASKSDISRMLIQRIAAALPPTRAAVAAINHDAS